MRVSQAAVDLLHEFEGLMLGSYPDPATNGDPWSIGYGHTGPDVKPGMRLTLQEADRLLEDDLLKFEKGVGELVAVPLKQHEFDALCVFAYNVGLEALKTSTLLRLINAEQKDDAAVQFLRWDKAADKQMPGLARRRRAEMALFLGE